MILLCLSTAVSADGSRDIILDSIRPDGHVDPELANATGWQRAYGFHWKILLVNERTGEKSPVSPHHQFKSGEVFRIAITAHSNLWFYALNVEGSGDLKLLLPDKRSEHRRIAKGESIVLPLNEGLGFRFTGAPSSERFYIVASPVALNDLEELKDAPPGRDRESAKKLAKIIKEFNSQQPAAINDTDWKKAIESVSSRRSQGGERDAVLLPPADELGQDVVAVSPKKESVTPIVVLISLRFVEP